MKSHYRKMSQDDSLNIRSLTFTEFISTFPILSSILEAESNTSQASSQKGDTPVLESLNGNLNDEWPEISRALMSRPDHDDSSILDQFQDVLGSSMDELNYEDLLTLPEDLLDSNQGVSDFSNYRDNSAIFSDVSASEIQGGSQVAISISTPPEQLVGAQQPAEYVPDFLTFRNICERVYNIKARVHHFKKRIGNITTRIHYGKM
ncbi:hypothetical protein HDV05_000941 [Chytridiales sp. JEL 0842]|nr:hypothetical protein HDV05_000941 [Chytridiales sp. JEL 0842]